MIAPVVTGKENEDIAIQFLKEKAEEKNNKYLLKKIDKIPSLEERSIDDFMTIRNTLGRFGSIVYKNSVKIEMFLTGFFSPLHSAKDKAFFIKSMEYSYNNIKNDFIV